MATLNLFLYLTIEDFCTLFFVWALISFNCDLKSAVKAFFKQGKPWFDPGLTLTGL